MLWYNDDIRVREKKKKRENEDANDDDSCWWCVCRLPYDR